MPNWVARLSEAGALSPLTTIVTALLAALTALSIAFLAYPWQKRKDRELQINLEKRNAYSRFFESSMRFYSAMMGEEESVRRTGTDNLRLCLNGMFFYATPDLLHECKAMITLMLIWNALFDEREEKSDEEFEASFERVRASYAHHESTAVALARSEILGLSFQKALDEITSYEEGKYIRLVEDEGAEHA